MKKVLLIFLFIFFANSAWAGLPSGPYIYWVNLTTQQAVTDVLSEYIKSFPDDYYCSEPHRNWITYHDRVPAGMERGILYRALVENKTDARKKIVSALKAFRDKDIYEGLDGVIAYVDSGAPRMISIDAHGKIINVDVSKINNKDKTIVTAFCLVTPEIYRY